MAIDLVRPLKIESPGEGGTETDLFPTEVDINEDYIGAKGFAVEGREDTRLDRDANGNMVFRDPVAGVKTLTQLAEGAQANEDLEAFAMIQGVL